MSFVDVFLSHLEAHADRAFVTEVQGERLVPTRGGRLREMIEQARHALRAAGVSKGDRVVLIAPNSARWVACDLAILAEGATCVPMYARQAPDELADMIRDCDPRLIVVGGAPLHDRLHSQEALQKQLAPHRKQVPAKLTVLDALFAGAPPATLERARELTPDDVVTIIYTSGSSGEPKGVMTSALNVEHMLPVLDSKLRELTGAAGGRDRVFHYLPFCFAGSRMVLWASLYRANGLFLSTNLEDLAREMRVAAPQYFLNVPALLERVRAGVEAKIAERPLPVRLLYERAIEAFRRERKGVAGKRDRALLLAAKTAIFPKIRAQIGNQIVGLICGSAPLAEETQVWFSELIGIPVFQVYGLTETTAIVSMDRVGAVNPGRVGYPIAGCDVKLGEGGELLVKGPNVFPGYFRRAEASRAALTSDGWFRTGDQASIDERGVIQMIGRVKNILVPSSGHNVAPEPIEQLLMERLPGVAQAVVIGHGRPYLVALLTGAIEQNAVETAIEAVNADLPHYRRIRRFLLQREPLTIESGLLTANQKLRRAQIEAHFAQAIDGLYA
ncbi:MAG: AMP-binding protein [Myxococcota bacterium]|nr:AMP-binding protein [Myxococcota bacterium]